jgi:hypothetical protein
MVNKEGTHGTTRSKAEAICTQGFRCGYGRGGSGVYFWHNNKYGIQLAKEWYQVHLDAGKYLHDLDNHCVIIIAKLITEDDEFLDLEDPSLKDKMAEILSAREVDNNNRAIASFYDAFIYQIETELGKKIKLLSLRVAPPKVDDSCYPIRFLGAPISYIARDNSCIHIQQIT